MKKLFLDNIRTVAMVYDELMEFSFDIIRIYEKFIEYIQKKRFPNYISFDNNSRLASGKTLVFRKLITVK